MKASRQNQDTKSMLPYSSLIELLIAYLIYESAAEEQAREPR